ncbi:HNH endonuclease [Microbacterium phage AluminumJesus]|nr:HNH endonuclease [Microbacterium phage Blab]UJD20787.1 HNH endonuclease [Microbacterium phage AluminumJesus]
MILTTTRRPASILERLDRRSEQVGGCFVWRGATDGRGYGSISYGGRTRPTHIVAYEVLIGEIPDGLVLDHLECSETLCWNPWHLDPVPTAVNTQRSNAKRWAAHASCKRDHPWEGDNIMIVSGKRRCRACHQLRSKGVLAA